MKQSKLPPLDEGLNDDFYDYDEDMDSEVDEYNEGWYAGYKKAQQDSNSGTV